MVVSSHKRFRTLSDGNGLVGTADSAEFAFLLKPKLMMLLTRSHRVGECLAPCPDPCMGWFGVFVLYCRVLCLRGAALF